MSLDMPDRHLPVPDPTALTTAALHREVATLRDAFAERMDEADRAAVGLNRERTEQFAALKELMGERIDGLSRLVEEKFASAERQRLEQKNDTKAAVDAALTAQKEAVREQTIASDKAISKSELATGKQLEQQQQTSSEAVGGLRRSIDDLKERIGEVASIANGTVQQKVGAKEDRTALPGSKMAKFGSNWRTNPLVQLKWAVWYGKTKYGSLCDAAMIELGWRDRHGNWHPGRGWW